MNRATEPRYSHGSAERCAVLLVNLGTPDAPTASALRRYLAQFLWDPRVVEIPRPLWWLILHGVILRLRPAKSAAKYAAIWTDAGSPLLTWTQRQAEALQAVLASRGHSVLVRPAMRYGRPAIDATLDALRAEGATRVPPPPAPSTRWPTGRDVPGACLNCASSTTTTTTPATSLHWRPVCARTGQRMAAARSW